MDFIRTTWIINPHDLSPLILLASCMSFGIMVTLLACMAHRLVSSKRPIRYASDASWRAMTAEDWNLRSFLYSDAISLTTLWKGNFLISKSVLFWYFLISLRATVPGLYLWAFFTPPAAGAVFLAALLARCFLGALVPVFFLAVYLVLAIVMIWWCSRKKGMISNLL